MVTDRERTSPDRAASVADVAATSRAGRPSVLDEFKPYLHERFNAGVTNISALSGRSASRVIGAV